MSKAAKYSSARDHDDVELDGKLLKIGENYFRSNNDGGQNTRKKFVCRNNDCFEGAAYFPLLDVFQTRHYGVCKKTKQTRAPASCSNSRYCFTLATI